MSRDLFGHATDDVPIARNSDPWTSHRAAHRFIWSGKRDTIHKKILRFLMEHWAEGYTSTEISRHTKIPTAHKRMPELERMELVERDDARKCTITNEQAITWILK